MIFPIEEDYEDVHPRPQFESPEAAAAAYQLVSLMGDISEQHYAAGWLSGLEYALFDVAYAGEQFGFGGVLGRDRPPHNHQPEVSRVVDALVLG